MQNMPHITPVEVAVVCSAAMILCILPSLIAWGDVRRVRRQRRTQVEAEAEALRRRAIEATPSAGVASMATFPVIVGDPPSVEMPLPEDGPDPTDGSGESAPPFAVGEAYVTPVSEVAAVSMPEAIEAPTTPTSFPDEVPGSGAIVEATSLTTPEPAVPAPILCTLRLDELRWVKLPHLPPPAVRSDPVRNRLWEEAQRVAAQPLITGTELPSPCRAESVCLESAESEGSVLRLRFLLFPELWPVAADQATAVAIFEIDSARGEVHSAVQALARFSHG